MKNILLIVFCLVVISASGQGRKASDIKWLNIALKGGYGGTMLFNSDVTAESSVSQNFLSPSYEFGGRLGITYGDYIGLGVELLSAGMNEEYTINAAGTSYTKNQKFNSLDLVVTARFTSPYGFFVDLGPKFSNNSSISVSNSLAGGTDENDPNYAGHFMGQYTSIVAGLGFALHNGDRFQVYLGVRGAYALGDLEEDPNFYVLNDGLYTPGPPTSAKTSPFTLKLTLELNYIFGFWGNASCGRGRLMLFQ